MNLIYEKSPDHAPKISRVWIDMSAVLLLPKGLVGGIPRTFHKLFEFWSRNPIMGLPTKPCVLHETYGIIEVDCDYVKSCAIPVPQEKKIESEVIQQTTSSIKRFIPWIIRHNLNKIRYARKKNPSNQGNDHHLEKRIDKNSVNQNQEEVPEVTTKKITAYPYPTECLIQPIEITKEDLIISLGGLWLIPQVNQILEKIKKKDQSHIVSVIYDLLPINAPQFFGPGVQGVIQPPTEYQMRNSDVLLAISEYVKNEIISHASKNQIEIGPVEKIVLGANVTNVEKKGLLNNMPPYVLTVGSIEARKNHYGMYMAWKKLKRTLGKSTPHLIMAGKPAWQGNEIIYLVQHDPETRDLIKVMTEVSDDKLAELYENCLFTLYPSFEEGWGLPVEESMVYGKLCITSNKSSMPEVGREYADYVEPDDINSIVNAIIKALDPNYRMNREKLIQEKFKPNSWESCAMQIEGIINKYFQL